MVNPSQTARRRFGRLSGVLAGLFAIIALLATTGGQAFAQRNLRVPDNGRGPKNGLYIVQLIEPPVVAYDGGVPGIPATRPAPGTKVNPNSQNVREYVRFLENRHDAKARAVGARKVYSYRYSFNGFAAALTADQVAILNTQPDVVAVTKDTLSQLDTSTTPAFLGLNAANGIWSALSGNADGNPITANGPNSGGAGEGVVVGILDSGIWPENPSFSDRDANGKRVFQQLPGWHGKCVPGEAFTAANCNQKLIAAQYFNSGWGGNAGVKDLFPYEFNSARAADGHGVHTAGTAAGNFGVTATVDGQNIGTISGIAPRARVAVYKTCWGIPPDGGCFNSDNVAAIDQAVIDGVDVINYSISGTSTNFRDPVEIAFLFAADAGVFVAASAGNSGPGASTVAHPSPWITTVAASTHDRVYEATASLGNGSNYTGVGLGAAVASSPLVYAGNVGLAGADQTEVELCYPGTLDPAQVSGTIVVCDRGVIARTDKSLAVQQAGGVGMILVNTSPSSVNADLHYVPTVHLDSPVRAAIVAYAETAGATASLSAGVQVAGATAPFMASFSSRGPLLAGDGNLLKPDITAPGVDVLAAYSPVAAGRNFDFLSGTSMSSPHIAGVAALLKDLYPTWSPAMIKSAMMTTAYQTTRTGNTGQVFGGPFDFGAGHVDPNPAMNPGIVFDAGLVDYLGFLCGTQLPASFCTGSGIPVLNPSDLNVPSIALGSLAGSQTVTREVTNVSGQTATFNAAVSGLSGLSVSVSPSSFTLAPGASQTVSVSFTNTSATLNVYATGAITWTSNKGHTARIPVVARPVALAAPATISSNGEATSFDVTFGYNGGFTATPRGLVAANTIAGNVVDDPSNDINTALGTGVGITFHFVNVPPGSTYARFSLFDEFTDGTDDLDLYVFDPSFNFVAGSGSGTSAEEVNVQNPVAGNWLVVVHGWQTDGPDANYTLYSWAIPSTDNGNMSVTAPATATLGGTGTVNVSFSGLTPATRYLGSIAYSGAAGMPNPTIVSVNTP